MLLGRMALVLRAAIIAVLNLRAGRYSGSGAVGKPSAATATGEKTPPP